MTETLSSATQKAKMMLTKLLALLDTRNLLEKLQYFDNDGGVMMEWRTTGVYCDIDSDGVFNISRAANPDAEGFVNIVTESFETTEDVAKCLQLLLIH